MTNDARATIEYRTARPDEMPAVMRAQALGFGATMTDDDVRKAAEETRIRPEWRLCAFDRGAPVAQVCIVPTRMHWNGHTLASAGVTDVFTVPTHRRRGALRGLMTRAFARMRNAGQAVAILEASMAAIYQRFGWAVVYTALMHDFDPRHLRFVDEIATPGEIRLVRREDARPVIEPVYRRFAAPRTLTFDRGDFEWQRAGHTHSTGPAPLVAVYEEDGKPLGYAIYSVSEHGERRPPPSQRLSVSELAWNTPAAHRALISYLAGHDLADSVRLWSMPLDDPLISQVDEPRRLNTAASDGALARIVDLEAALAARGYAGRGRLVLGIEDVYAPWNTGTWELTVDGGAAVRKVDAKPQLTLTPRVLALLVCGTAPATTLARGGLIECADPPALPIADALFCTTHTPVCLDHWM